MDTISDTAVATTPPAALAFDPARYRDEIAGFDLTDEQALELLETLWDIMRSFVELGVSIDIGAALIEGCGVPEDEAETLFGIGKNKNF